MSYQLASIPGDGIGPEVVAAARRVLEAAGLKAEWTELAAGLTAYEQGGNPLPEETLAGVQRADGTLKGPTATAKGSGFRSVNVALRQQLTLFANYRPARSMPGIESRYEDVDLIVIRENTEGLYSGLEHEVVDGVVESLRIITRKASERIARFAFETARRQQRRQVTCVHKANILKLSDGLFLETCQEVAQDYKDIAFNDWIVDAAAMQMVRNPQTFDVLVMENLFGDILSDLASGLVGGLGVTPSANVGSDLAVFEAVHGTAPDIAGQGIANPTALILSGVLMLRYLGETVAADAVETAIQRVMEQGEHQTGDLGGSATTDQFVEAVIAKLP